MKTGVLKSFMVRVRVDTELRYNYNHRQPPVPPLDPGDITLITNAMKIMIGSKLVVVFVIILERKFISR